MKTTRSFAALLSLVISCHSFAQNTIASPDDGRNPAVVRDIKDYNVPGTKLAIEGYDPVAYFPANGAKAVKGEAKFEYTYRALKYRFANQSNLDTFKNDPRRYEPAYGGWCATAMADGGRKVEIDPRNFKVTNDRLFLFYKGLFTNALDDWKKDEPKSTTNADAQWKQLTGEVARGPTPPTESPGSGSGK